MPTRILSPLMPASSRKVVKKLILKSRRSKGTNIKFKNPNKERKKEKKKIITEPAFEIHGLYKTN